MRWSCWLGFVVAATAACSDPTIEVSFGFTPDQADLRAAITRMDLSVLVLTDVDCHQIRYGRVTAEDRALGLRTRVSFTPAQGDVALTDVPRLGPTLFVFEGYDEFGRLIAGGCDDRDEDIDDDLKLVIDVESAARVRLVPSATPTPPSVVLSATSTVPVSFQVVAVEQRRNGAALGAAALEVTLRTVDGELPGGTATLVSGVDGTYLVTVSPPPATMVGPGELVVRAPWADRVLTVSVYVEARVVGAVGLTDSTLGEAIADPHWTMIDRGDVRAGAIARYQDGTVRLVLVREFADAPRLRLGTLDVPDLRALARFKGGNGVAKLIARLSTGWVAVEWNPLGLTSLTTAPTTSADELFAVGCDDAPAIGLLARTGTGDYEAFDAPGAPAAGDKLLAIANGINALVRADPTATVRVTSVECDGRQSAPAPVVVVRREGAGVDQVFLVTAGGTALTAFTGAVTSFVAPALGGARWSLLGGVRGVDGDQLVSYRMVATNPPVLLPDGVIDHPLAGSPSSLGVFLANTDPYPDTVVVTNYGPATVVQATLGAEQDDGELSAVVLPVNDDPGLQIERANLLDLSDGRTQLLLMNRFGISALDLSTPR